MRMLNAAKRHGVGLMGIVVPTFWSYIIPFMFAYLTLSTLGLRWSLIIGIALFVSIYVLMTKRVMQNKIKKGELETLGHTASGVPVFKIEDSIANAIAIGFCKHFQYIIISTGLLKLFNDNPSEYAAIIEHEGNHIRLMHNLTGILTGIFILIVYTSMLSIAAINTPIVQICIYIAITVMFFLFSRLLSRSFETMADKTSDPEALRSALAKMDEHNKVVTNSKPKRFNLGIFSTHPRVDERPLKPNQLKEVSIAGLFVSFLIAIGLIARIFLDTPFNSNMMLLGIVIIFSVSLFGTAIIVIEYMFISNLAAFFAKKFNVQSLYQNNALNGIIILMILTVIPILTGINNLAIMGIFSLCAIGIAIVTTAVGTEPFKKGFLVSSLSWIINAAIFIAAYMTILGILFNIL
ncbi:MAG: M56 family metallopeptidase [Nitrososphaerota archaeon]|nr:M56 family metallopeptidase [Nitrososphaerota archaeon]